MNKLFLFCLFTFINLSVNAQNIGGSASKNKTNTTISTGIKADAANAASEICDCFNNYMSELHPKLTEFMIEMAEKGEEEATKSLTAYITTASAEEQQKIMQDVQRMEKAETELDTRCNQELDKKYKKYDNNKEFEDLMLQNLKNKPKCNLTYVLIQSQQGKD
jgi:hypothetical protein